MNGMSLTLNADDRRCWAKCGLLYDKYRWPWYNCLNVITISYGARLYWSTAVYF